MPGQPQPSLDSFLTWLTGHVDKLTLDRLARKMQQTLNQNENMARLQGDDHAPVTIDQVTLEHALAILEESGYNR